MDWNHRFEEIGAFWLHDGNQKRPYALLTSGKISNFFFNSSKVLERPNLLESVADALAGLARKELPEEEVPDVVVGPSLGALTLAYEVACALPPARAWFTEEDKDTKHQTLKRFAPEEGMERILVVEDVITTGRSTQETIDAVTIEAPSLAVYPFVLCVINRSGKATLPDGKRIIPLLEIPTQSWVRGKNPFTQNGQEIVEPVRPKTNWNILTQPY
jgi:orotate phosphoribosyltransferase